MSTREQMAIEFYAILYHSENESQRADVHCEQYRLRKAAELADKMIAQLAIPTVPETASIP